MKGKEKLEIDILIFFNLNDTVHAIYIVHGYSAYELHNEKTHPIDRRSTYTKHTWTYIVYVCAL